MSAAKSLIVEPEPNPAGGGDSVEPWATLTTQLRRRGRKRGLTAEDAEDRAQEALIRMLKEPTRRSAPPAEVRAARAHRLAEIDEFRRSTRDKEIPLEVRLSFDADEVAQVPVEVDFDARLRLAEVIAAVQETVGHDAIKLLFEGEAGYTEAESNERRATGGPSSGALRKRISRATPEIVRIIHDLKGGR
jgi:hypothetical protein